MKWTRIFGALGLLAGFCYLAYARPSGASQPSSHSDVAFSIVLTGPSGPIPLNWPVTVTWTATNISNRDIYWETPMSTRRDVGYLQFSYLLERDGHEVATTWFNRLMTGRQRPGDPNQVMSVSSWVLLPHPPGKIFTMAIDLKRLYKISEPGTYTFQVSRHDDVSKTLVKSNTITITVTEPSQAPPSEPIAALPMAAATSYTLGISILQNNVSYAPAIAPQAYTVKSGSEIRLEFYVTNTSDHKIEYDPAITTYLFDVRNARGESAPLTPAGQNLRKLYGVGRGKLLPVPVLPRETVPAGAAQLDRIYDLSKPGLYTIQASRFDEETETWVKSNTITLTVTP